MNEKIKKELEEFYNQNFELRIYGINDGTEEDVNELLVSKEKFIENLMLLISKLSN